MKPVRLEQGCLPGYFFRIQLRDPPDDKAAHDYLGFAAKKALTFPKNSISRFSSAFSACSALYLPHSTGPGSFAPASGCSCFHTRTQFHGFGPEPGTELTPIRHESDSPSVSQGWSRTLARPASIITVKPNEARVSLRS
jgi:hypothetical protein